MSQKGHQLPAISPQLDRIESKILLIRGQKVMLDSDLAFLYGVQSKRLNEAVQRNLSRFPEDFMFKLTQDEFVLLRSQFATSNLRSQIVTSSRGGRRYLPYVFTEQGVAMLSSVLKSPRAIMVNVEIMRAFVRLRRILAFLFDLVFNPQSAIVIRQFSLVSICPPAPPYRLHRPRKDSQIFRPTVL